MLVEGKKFPQSPFEPSLRDGQRILRTLELRTLGVGMGALFFVLRESCVEVSLHGQKLLLGLFCGGILSD